MKILVKQLGGIQKTVHDAEDALAGVNAVANTTDCVFAYVDVKNKRTVSFHNPNPLPYGIPTLEEVETGEYKNPHHKPYKGQEYILVYHGQSPSPDDEDTINVKLT